MLERIRRRLTLGYVGIFALILLIVGAVVVASFARQAATQQDELLEQRARGDADFVSNALLDSYRKEKDPANGDRGPEGPGEGGTDRGGPGEHGPGEEGRTEGPEPEGPFKWSRDPDLGMVALVPGTTGDAEGTVLDSTSSATSFGLPYEGPARVAVEREEAVAETVEGPEGAMVRIVSVPVTEREGDGVAVIQAAQSRRVVREAVGSLLVILVPVGVGGLLLAGVGGLVMSGRAMRPVRESFRRQRTFIADASHELKTPLALVKIGAEVMQRNPADPENGEVVEDQLAEIDRMDALLSDLLILARLDAGRLDVEEKPFDLAAVSGEAAGRFLKRAATEHVSLEVDLPDELPARGDADKTAQVLAALLDNAVRHTPEGGTVTVAARHRNGRAEATVTDTGPGISPEHLPRVFDRFYRAEEARTRKGGGTGLGLAIARDLARAQDGDLSAEDVPDGARFTLTIPAGA